MCDRIVSCRNVVKTFEGVTALDGLTLDVDAGEIVALIGPNGSGKTTTMRTLLGIYPAEAGEVSVLGCDPARQFELIGPRLGVMLEQPGLSDKLSALEYLTIYARLFDIPVVEIDRRVNEVLGIAGLSERAGERLGGYSKGMRQRISLARCLLNRPRLLILDEPFDGVDTESRRTLFDVLRAVPTAGGASVLITSHNLDDIEKLATRVVILDHGRVVRSESLERLCGAEPGNEVVIIQVGGCPASVIEETIASISGASWRPTSRQLAVDLRRSGFSQQELLIKLIGSIPVQSFALERQTLEEVYFSVTQKEHNS